MLQFRNNKIYKEFDLMPNLTKNNIFGANYYRLNVLSATGYRGGEFGQFSAAPLIHTYSSRMESASPRLAIRQDGDNIIIRNKQYQVKQFLTVQCLNNSLVTDEAGNFRPTVKPHYAIAPVNGIGTIFSRHCNTLLTDADGVVVQNRALPVHAHDGLLSPPQTIDPLKQQLIASQQEEESKFYISYVVDEVNNQILVTQHCLLNEIDHTLLCQTLDDVVSPTLEGLIEANTSISRALERFRSQVTAESSPVQAVMSYHSPSVLPVATPLSSSPTTASNNISASFWLKALATAAIGVGFIALALCTWGAVAAVAGAALGAAAAYSCGATAGGALAALGLFGYRQASEDYVVPDVNQLPSAL